MLRVEFHSHTVYSKDSLSKPQAFVRVCRQKGLDRVVITDHNRIAGALEAKKIDPELVIAGEEIMTSHGELLAFFLDDEVPAGLDPRSTIDRLRDQGAFISISHPFDHLRNGSWKEDQLLEIIPFVDAIEVFNSRCIFKQANQMATDFAQKHNLVGTVGSDAHALFELGNATMILDGFHDAHSLCQVIRGAQVNTQLASPWVHFTSRFAVWSKAINRRSRK